MPLSEQRRQQLDGIVEQMVATQEPDENIQWVVNDFKSKYENETPNILGKMPSVEIAPTVLGRAKQTLGAIKDIGIGIGQDIHNVVRNVGGFGEKIIGAPARALGLQQKTGASQIPKLEPQNEGQQVGQAFSQIAQTILPMTKVAKAERAIDILSEGLKLSKAGKAVVRIVGKAGVEGLASGGIRAAQTGDVKEGLTAGLVTGGVRGAMGVIGETARALNIPEKLYSRIFKNTYQDMAQEIKTVGTQNFQQKYPERFKELVRAGIIKTSKTGEVVLDETLAKEALNRGLKGSLNHMGNEVVRQTYELENEARQLAKNSSATIKLEPQYGRLLKEISLDYKDVGFGEISKEANQLSRAIKGGKADADTILRLRRFLDGMRLKSSFGQGTGKLTQTQQNFRTLADTLRNRLAKSVPGMAGTMDDYRFNIQALESIVKEAARRGNNQVIGQIDSILFGGGILTGQPGMGIAAGLVRRGLNNPSVLTGLGTAIQKTAVSAGGILGRSLLGMGAAKFSPRQAKED